MISIGHCFIKFYCFDKIRYVCEKGHKLALNSLGCLHHNFRNYILAEQYFKLALKYIPDKSSFYLGCLYLDKYKDIEKAIEYFKFDLNYIRNLLELCKIYQNKKDYNTIFEYSKLIVEKEEGMKLLELSKECLFF